MESQDLTSAFNDNSASTASDLDLVLADDCGTEKDDFLLNKIRVRDEGTSCAVPKSQDGPIIPEIFQPDKPVVDQLEQLNDPNEQKCALPYLYNLCCSGLLDLLFSAGPPRVWASVDNCYLNPCTF